MNSLIKRVSAGLLALLLVFSLVSGSLPVASYAASKNDSTTRHNYNVELSSQALSYYTGNYTWAKLSALEGGGASCLDMDSDLFDALHTLMSDTMTKSISYNSLTSHWPTTDDNMLFYSDFESTSYNREHVWPKSHASFEEKNGGCDLHHLRPTNSTINSTRSNYTFGNVKEKVSGYKTKENGGQTVLWYSSSYSSSGGDGLVEVRDNIKGDVARILLYVYVRWEEPNLFEKDTSPTVGPNDNKNDGLKVIEDLETLLEWCEIDPVDQWEMTRNDLTQNVQGNRNVFIDYPEFAWLLFGEDVPSGYNTPSDNGGSAANPGTPGCTHQWSSATCTLPKTCTKCGATDGAAQGHKWQNATCQQAKKCSTCGTTEGSVGNHADANSDNACDVCGTSMGTTQPSQGGNVYVKVTQTPADWSGKYLIVCEGKKVAFDGALLTLDATNNTIPVTISDSQIVLDVKYANAYFTIATYSSGYSIQSSSGLYIGQTSNANGLQSDSSTIYENALSFSGSNLTAKSGGAYLRFNDDSNQMRFRYYKSGTYSLQEPVALYKLQETHTHAYTKVVTAPTCTAGGYTTYTCSCGDSYQSNQVAAKGHSYTGVITKVSTCTVDGVKTYTCTCGDSYTEVLSATGHTASTAVTEKIVSATCTADGSYDTVVYCFACNAQISRVTTIVSALGHDNEYVNNDDGTHNYTCGVCGTSEIKSEKHYYDNDADTDCNACKAVREIARKPVKVATSNMTLGNSLALNFYVFRSELEADEDYFLRITKKYADGRADLVKDVPMSEWVIYTGDTRLYRIDFAGIAAKEMGDDVVAQVFYADGTAAGATYTDSVLAYAEYMLGATTNEELKTLLVDMLNYGAAAQNTFKYDRNNLVNANLTAEQQALATKSVSYTDDFERNGSGYTDTLTLESNILLQMYFTDVESDMYAIVEYEDHFGTKVRTRVEFAKFEQYSGSTYRVPVDTLVIADGKQIVTCTMYNSAGEAVGQCIDSVASYLGAMQALENADAIYEQTMKFVTSSYNYFH